AQKVFIRGLSFNSYLSYQKSSLLAKVEDLALQTEQLSAELERLCVEIQEFNARLDHALLSDMEIRQILAQLSDLHQLLDGAKTLQPAVLYVLYRFSQTAIAALREKRDRWSGDSGIEGWNGRFRDILHWRDEMRNFTDQIEEAFSVNEPLKIEIL